MRLELPVRWTEADREFEKLSELLNNENPKEEEIYTYGKLSIDSEDIGPYYNIDPDHIMLNDKLGKVYCICVPFDHFKKIYTEVSGKAILSIQTSEEYLSKKPKDRGSENGSLSQDEIDDILDD